MARLPASASVANRSGGAKLHAPAAERNADAIAGLLRDVAPARGHALELASGTGQHIVRFAETCPGLHWHPTDVDADRIASIDAYAKASGLRNIAPAARLDATDPGWAAARSYDLIVLINLLHLVPDRAAGILLDEVTRDLQSGGVFVLYGPFKRGGVLTSDGDVRFDTELRAADAGIGYKDDGWIGARLTAAGLDVETREMAANNLTFIARCPS